MLPILTDRRTFFLPFFCYLLFIAILEISGIPGTSGRIPGTAHFLFCIYYILVP